MTEHETATGGCLCGAVRYRVTGPLRPVAYCHCTQCRRTSGHFVAATACAPADLELQGETGLRWYRSSAEASRGFCSTCGSSIFWRPDHGRHVSIMAGTIDGNTGLEGSHHIWLGTAGDYYTIDDGLPRFDDRGPDELRG